MPIDREKLEVERLKLVIDIWKKTVEVQQHFNDLELRIRNFALTLLVGILGGTAFAIQQGFRVPAGSYQFSLASLLLLVGFVAWAGFWVLDRHWYHRLLIGSVEHGHSIEKRHSATLPDLSLTHAISGASHVVMDTWKRRIWYHLIGVAGVSAAVTGPIWLLRRDLFTTQTLFGVFVAALTFIAALRWALMRDWKIRARHRIDFFYGIVAIMLLILAWAANSAVRPVT